jgi:FeS assembly SUF system protein
MKPLPMASQNQAGMDLPPEGGSHTGGSHTDESHADGLVADPVKTEALSPAITAALKTVYDPEIPVDIWELGLIYDVFVTGEGVASIKMTLTAPGCPAAQVLPGQVGEAAKTVEGITDAKVEVVWEPGWTKDRMSDVAKLQLGMW